MRNINPTLTPLLKELYSLNIGNFFKTASFNKLCHQLSISDVWHNSLIYAKANPHIVSTWAGANYEEEEAFEIFIDHLYVKNLHLFDITLFEVLKEFMLFMANPSYFKKIFNSINNVNFNENFLKELQSLYIKKISSSQSDPPPPIISKESIIDDINRLRIPSAIIKLRNIIQFPDDMHRLYRLESEYIYGNDDPEFTNRLVAFVNSVFHKLP